MLKSHELAQTQDDGFREIQLNGKQLVFLFMVVTIWSVGIFLCGVFVGRGVRAERAALVADAGTASPVTTPDVVPSQEPAPPAAAGSDPTAAAPPPAVDELSYFTRLEKTAPPAEELKPAGAAKAEKAAPPPPAPAKGPGKPAEKSVAKAAPEAAAASPGEPSGQGFAIQVSALRERNEAEVIAKRLSAKGYAAYVVTPANGAPNVFRVRVGKFKTKREAEAIATRLQKEEQFSPWITR